MGGRAKTGLFSLKAAISTWISVVRSHVAWRGRREEEGRGDRERMEEVDEKERGRENRRERRKGGETGREGWRGRWMRRKEGGAQKQTNMHAHNSTQVERVSVHGKV